MSCRPQCPARAALATLVLAIAHAGAVAAGSLEPPGPPAPTMKTLFECEPRTALLGSGPIVITAPGSYYLTQDVSTVGVDGVHVQASDVTLDLDGFTVRTEQAGLGVAALRVQGVGRVTVRNGRIADSGFGIYVADAGPVEVDGVRVSSAWIPLLARRSDVTVTRCRFGGEPAEALLLHGTVRVWDTVVEGGSSFGIIVESGSDFDVRRCTVAGARVGIEVAPDALGLTESRGVIMDNVVTRCTETGIRVGDFFPLTDVLVARNFSSGNPTNYSLGSATAAPIVALSAGPSGWDNVQ